MVIDRDPSSPQHKSPTSREKDRKENESVLKTTGQRRRRRFILLRTASRHATPRNATLGVETHLAARFSYSRTSASFTPRANKSRAVSPATILKSSTIVSCISACASLPKKTHHRGRSQEDSNSHQLRHVKQERVHGTERNRGPATLTLDPVHPATVGVFKVALAEVKRARHFRHVNKRATRLVHEGKQPLKRNEPCSVRRNISHRWDFLAPS